MVHACSDQPSAMLGGGRNRLDGLGKYTGPASTWSRDLRWTPTSDSSTNPYYRPTEADKRMRSYNEGAQNRTGDLKLRNRSLPDWLSEMASDAVREGVLMYTSPGSNPYIDLSNGTVRERTEREVSQRLEERVSKSYGGVLDQAVRYGRARLDFGGDTEADRLEGIALELAMLRQDSKMGHAMLAGSDDGTLATDGVTRGAAWRAAITARLGGETLDSSAPADTEWETALENARKAERAASYGDFNDEIDDAMSLANSALDGIEGMDGGSRKSITMTMIAATGVCSLALGALAMTHLI